ncbi:MAG: heavy-metal-associated domain-containing protein [Bryobacterales bacterium]|nr:heavy-metal-associated domain-containing protein [Bryobacterales bacterium]
MQETKRLSAAQSKSLVVVLGLAIALLAAGSIWWGLSHPTPASLKVVTPAQTPGGPAVVQAKITVNGMSCEGCAASITSSLTKMGVDSVVVSLEERSAVVTFRTDKISLSTILEKITEIGYEPKLDS